MKQKVVYVVIGWKQRNVNDRVKKIISLKNEVNKIVLVSVGRGYVDDENIVIRPFFNPTVLLRLLGLRKAKKALDRILYFPSRYILYVSAVKRKLKWRISDDINKGKDVCLITCVPPHDLCLIGLSMKNLFPQIRWIVDWQDLWSYDEYYFGRIRDRYKNRLIVLEKEILAKSDLNVTTNSYAKNILEKNYGVPSGQVVAINHPFSRDDFRNVPDRMPRVFVDETGGVIRIGFLGALFKPPKVPGERVVEAIRYVRSLGINVELHVFGDSSDTGKLMSRKGYDGWLVFHEALSHKESLIRVASCDYLLLVLGDLPNCRVIMNAKLPHYLLIGKPIIAIVPDPSAVADVVTRTGAGRVIPVDCNWGEKLRCLLNEKTDGMQFPERDETVIESFDWANISKQWEEIIEFT